MSVRVFGNVILNNPPGTPIPAAAAWASAFQFQSTWAGTDPFFPSPPSSATDVPDCLFDIPNTQAITVGTSYVIPPGAGYASVPNTASSVVAFQLLTGTGAGTWTTIGPATAATALCQTYFSDGANVRHNVTGAGCTIVYYPMR